jgi:hypothetical protein
MSHVRQIEEEDDVMDSIADDDYIFIMDSEGNLKSVMLPEEYTTQITPENVEKVMKIFGLVGFESKTLH